MADITVRRATQDDIPQILQTLRMALGETPLLRRSPELWEWKHSINPFGRSIVLVAEDGGRIAGVRAMMRWDLMTADGAILKCVRPVDTATHPEYLRRGIFRSLTLSALEEARNDGVHLVFNTPNDKSAPGYLQMGWGSVAGVGVMVRPRLGRAVAPSAGTLPSIAELAPSLSPIGDLDLQTKDRPPLGLRTPRSKSYVSWRFGAHPTASYGYLLGTNGGVAVARANARGSTSELVVSDLLGVGTETVRGLARVSRSRYMAGWFSPKAPERGVAIRGGMIPIPVRRLRLVALPLSNLGVDVFEFGSWDLATSDLELL